MQKGKVERLQSRIEANRESRERELLKDKALEDRLKVIREAFPITRLGFWCRKCRQDFEGQAFKQVRYPASGGAPVAWYRSFCPKRHEAIRRITDKLKDNYYYESEMLKRQRIDLADAMLTPDDPRFRVVYPDQWQKLEQEREMREWQEAEGIKAIKDNYARR